MSTLFDDGTGAAPAPTEGTPEAPAAPDQPSTPDTPAEGGATAQ